MNIQQRTIKRHRTWLAASAAALAVTAMAAPQSLAVPPTVHAAAPASSYVALVGDRPLLGLALAGDIGTRLRLQGVAIGTWAVSTGRVR